MPLVRVVDMRLEAAKHKGGPAILSDKLRTALEQRLEKGEQSILFLNRRGFARSLQCPACGHVCQCPHCAVALTYHRTDERLVCHVCGHQAIVPRKCPECRDPASSCRATARRRSRRSWPRSCPKAKIARIDADAMRRKHALRDTLNAFKSHKIDILIGTQMIAKGLHFPNVTLVGILNADLGLHVPDFRAGERTFQLITQVAGRAGRGDLEGEVIVQTFTPHSPSIQFARRHDFDGFSEQEMEFRRSSVSALRPLRGSNSPLDPRAPRRVHPADAAPAARRRTCRPGITLGEVLPSPLVRSTASSASRSPCARKSARPLTRHVQAVLARTTLPEDVTVVFDMDALNFPTRSRRG
jgi:primosomal protein N' (replication factor Y) (superfamily II helicase)